jgi:hypothetical protein
MICSYWPLANTPNYQGTEETEFSPVHSSLQSNYNNQIEYKKIKKQDFNG